jgi:uncharacterized protein YndB with AHSA1/START domain
MPDIYSDVPIRASRDRVFQAVSTPDGLDAWWTKKSAGRPVVGAEFELWFGPNYDWRATVAECRPDSAFELRITRADNDWVGTRVGFQLDGSAGLTHVRFAHTGWPDANEHWRVSCYCWPIYLRLLRRYLEHGELVPYENRLDV